MRREVYKIDNFWRDGWGRYFGHGLGLVVFDRDRVRGAFLRRWDSWAGFGMFFRFLYAFLLGVVAFLGVTVCKWLCFQMRSGRYKIDNISRASARAVLLSPMRTVGLARCADGFLRVPLSWF
jgi:hypothetical protein